MRASSSSVLGAGEQAEGLVVVALGVHGLHEVEAGVDGVHEGEVLDRGGDLLHVARQHAHLEDVLREQLALDTVREPQNVPALGQQEHKPQRQTPKHRQHIR
jgi:hypothetical protein